MRRWPMLITLAAMAVLVATQSAFSYLPESQAEVAVDGVPGYEEQVIRRTIASPADAATAQAVTWTMRSALRYRDYGEAEDVSGASDNWTDTQVYMLEVRGELHHNGTRIWQNTVRDYYTTYVSSGYSPYFRGYNAYWQSKGFHSMQVTPGSRTETGYTQKAKQF